MSSDIQRLNRHLASALPSATYRIIDRVAERRAQGATIISLCEIGRASCRERV